MPRSCPSCIRLGSCAISPRHAHDRRMRGFSRWQCLYPDIALSMPPRAGVANRQRAPRPRARLRAPPCQRPLHTNHPPRQLFYCPWALVGRALVGPPGPLWAVPLWAGPLWAPWTLVGQAPLGPWGPGLFGPPEPMWAGPLWAPPGPLWAGPLWVPWALAGRALVGSLGPLWARPLLPPSALIGRALMGPLGPLWKGPYGHPSQSNVRFSGFAVEPNV